MSDIFLMGKRYSVPDTLTIIQALEYCGIRLVRGVGCRGGVCGACATVFRVDGKPGVQVALACQTVVRHNMHFLQIPYYPTNRPVYDVKTALPGVQAVAVMFPEILRCVGCNTCTTMCPKHLRVLDLISGTLRGAFQEVSKHSFECVQCDLCATRCPAGIAPGRVTQFVRRLVGCHMKTRAPDLEERVAQIGAHLYDAELDRLVDAPREVIEEMHVRFRSEMKSAT